MKYDIVFKTKEAFTAAKTLLTHHYACRFNDLDDYRIEFYLEGRRETAKKMLPRRLLRLQNAHSAEKEYYNCGHVMFLSKFAC